MKKLLLLVLNLAAAMSIITFSGTASAQLGSLSTDLVFNPVTPCRMMDTRGTGAKTGILVAGSTRSFYGVSLSGNYPSQGGTSPNCTVPYTSDVAAIVVNFTVVTPDAAGYITAYPGDATKPVAATVNFTAGSVVGNNATLKISQTGSDGEFKIYSTANTHVVADIVGYYAKPISVGSFVCEDTTPVSAPISVTPFNSLYYGFATATACSTGYTQVALRCYTDNAIASAHEYVTGSCAANSPINTHTLYASRRCCRIPGR